MRRLRAYVPGEQPKIRGLIKLNTNENPFPPSPKVLRAVKAAVDGRLRLYPNPTAEPLRGKLAALHHCRPENLIVGNGSDELLALATRAFVEPAGAGAQRRAVAGDGAIFFAQLLALSGAGGHRRRAPQSGPAGGGFRAAFPGRTEGGRGGISGPR